jgi:hypothetical protein
MQENKAKICFPLGSLNFICGLHQLHSKICVKKFKKFKAPFVRFFQSIFLKNMFFIISKFKRVKICSKLIHQELPLSYLKESTTILPQLQKESFIIELVIENIKLQSEP